MKRLPFLILACALAPACTDDSGPAAGGGPTPPPPSRVERARDPRVATLRAAIDAGQLDLARSSWAQAEPQVDGVERELLAARLAALAGDDLIAAQHVESARRIDARDPRVAGTAAELAAWGGRVATADQELRQAQELFGAAVAIPELLRARGIALICQQGGARPGLALLEQAVELDADLPFVGRALGQAHLLVGKSFAGTQKKVALEHARKSVLHDPDEVDARHFLGEMFMATGLWGDGIAEYEQLLADGEPIAGELASYCEKAGVWGVTTGEVERGLEYLLRARELGLAEEHFNDISLKALRTEALRASERARAANDAGATDAAEEHIGRALQCVPGFGPALSELASVCVARGVAALENTDELSGDEAAAAAIVQFRQALVHDKESLEAHHFLGRAYYRAGRYGEAADEFHWVVDTARLEKISLPEPVHINLARALLLADREEGVARAHDVLDAYLVLDAAGPWVAETKRFKSGLPEPAPPVDDGR